ncbi:hypothetical protein HAX54_016736 [Datura stramonium]|uniref:Uncharacterized protein n=1 Tax=Datura stramonium TaxID=4076 RepID=A0ABS8UKP2_DATST|nr:hypothetical protein [Datura stramonium]
MVWAYSLRQIKIRRGYQVIIASKVVDLLEHKEFVLLKRIYLGSAWSCRFPEVAETKYVALLDIQVKHVQSHIQHPKLRDDGWFEVELGGFYTDHEDGCLEIHLKKVVGYAYQRESLTVGRYGSSDNDSLEIKVVCSLRRFDHGLGLVLVSSFGTAGVTKSWRSSSKKCGSIAKSPWLELSNEPQYYCKTQQHAFNLSFEEVGCYWWHGKRRPRYDPWKHFHYYSPWSIVEGEKILIDYCFLNSTSGYAHWATPLSGPKKSFIFPIPVMVGTVVAFHLLWFISWDKTKNG